MKGLDYLATLTRWDGTGEFNLTALSRVLNYFGNPQDKVPSIHVGGTNGKGSVCVTTAAIIGAAGYRCGLATSPHLSRINERIVIDGHEVDDYSLSTLALELERSCVRKKETLTYHEALTAMSFLAFFENKVDWMVVEVGLGGTLDASNVISKPEISVITTIDFDHEDILGNSLRLIAREKAGIIKNGSRVVIGPMSAEAREIILKIF